MTTVTPIVNCAKCPVSHCCLVCKPHLSMLLKKYEGTVVSQEFSRRLVNAYKEMEAVTKECPIINGAPVL